MQAWLRTINLKFDLDGFDSASLLRPSVFSDSELKLERNFKKTKLHPKYRSWRGPETKLLISVSEQAARTEKSKQHRERWDRMSVIADFNPPVALVPVVFQKEKSSLIGRDLFSLCCFRV
jgi:hypothetical protein